MALYALGDLHISSTIWDLQKSITGDSAFMLEEIKALLSGDDDLVLVGDIWDSSEPGPVLLRLFREWAEEVTAAGNRLWALQGNHDKRLVSWPDALTSCVTPIGNGEEVMIAGNRCRGFDYAPRDVIAKRMAWLGTQVLPEILFVHQAAKQYLEIGQWNLDLEWIPAGIPVVVMADIHEPWETQIRQGQWAGYTGAGHTRSITEARHPKSVLWIPADRPLERIPIRSRAIKAFKLEAATLESTRKDVRAWVQGTMAADDRKTAPVDVLGPVVYLTYTSDVPSAPDLILEAVADLGVQVHIVGRPVVLHAAGTTRADLATAVQGIPGIPDLLDKSGLAKTPETRGIVLELIRPGKASEIRCRLDIIRAQFFKDYDARVTA